MQTASIAPVTYPRRSDAITAPPLTHHEIIGLIAPFTRRGRHADLGASDRIQRRLAFKPIEHGGDALDPSAIRETLTLENPRAGLHRLVRTLTLRNGLTATLQIDGTDPGELLAAIENVPPPRQFPTVAGRPIAQSYRLESGAGKAAVRMVLTSAEARFDGLTLLLKAETGKGYPAEITLRPEPDASLELPDDLLAALGWDWSVLRRRGGDWIGSLQARGGEPKRSQGLEARLAQTVTHLAKTLSEPPAQFHMQMARARWGVMLRRTIPLLFCLGLIVGSLALTLLKIPTDSMLQMLLFNLPPLLMMGLFGMRELPRVEIPPVPRPSSAAAWQASSAPGCDPSFETAATRPPQHEVQLVETR